MHSLTNYYQLDGERNVIYSYPWLPRLYFIFCQNYREVNITCCLNDSSSRSLSEANLWLSRRTSRSASSPCKVIVCVMFRSNSKFVLINKTYRPREWSILHWLYVDAVKAESVQYFNHLARRDSHLEKRDFCPPAKRGLQWWSNGGSRGGSRGSRPPLPHTPIRNYKELQRATGTGGMGCAECGGEAVWHKKVQQPFLNQSLDPHPPPPIKNSWIRPWIIISQAIL